jgi:hypothetical protein
MSRDNSPSNLKREYLISSDVICHCGVDGTSIRDASLVALHPVDAK